MTDYVILCIFRATKDRENFSPRRIFQEEGGAAGGADAPHAPPGAPPFVPRDDKEIEQVVGESASLADRRV